MGDEAKREPCGGCAGHVNMKVTTAEARLLRRLHELQSEKATGSIVLEVHMRCGGVSCCRVKENILVQDEELSG
jgi:hypothetical protein